MFKNSTPRFQKKSSLTTRPTSRKIAASTHKLQAIPQARYPVPETMSIYWCISYHEAVFVWSNDSPAGSSSRRVLSWSSRSLQLGKIPGKPNIYCSAPSGPPKLKLIVPHDNTTAAAAPAAYDTACRDRENSRHTLRTYMRRTLDTPRPQETTAGYRK